MTDNNKGGRSRRSTAPGKRAPGGRGKNQGAADGPAGATASGSGKGKGRSAARKAGRSGSAGKPAPWLPDPPPPPAAGRRDPSRAAAAPVGGHDGPAAAQAPAVADPYAERERRRYANPIPSREAIIAFLAGQGRLLKSDAIAEGLGLTTPDRFDALGKRLAAMLRDGQLHMNRRGGYGVADKLNLIAGSVLGKEDGFGFLRPDAGGDDIFLSPSQMRRVLHGDRVMVASPAWTAGARKKGSSSRSWSGARTVSWGLQRTRRRRPGRSDDSRIHQDVVIPPDARGQAATASWWFAKSPSRPMPISRPWAG